MKHRHYNRILILIFCLLFAIVSGFMIWLEPYSGDLTRIGAFQENRYGWNQHQKKFKSPHYKIGSNLNEYDSYFDIVTIGDSFSVNEFQSWQNYLSLSCNASIITFHRRSVNITDLLKSNQFKMTPPKLVIYEVVEHGIQTALHDIDTGRKIDFNENENQISLSFQNIDFSMLMESYEREKTNKFSMDTAIHYIKTNIKQILGSRIKAIPKVIESKEMLFSNNHSDAVLFYHLDNLKESIDSEEWEIIEQRFATAQALIENNKKTRFLAMIAPDKRTVYNHLLMNEKDGYKSALESMPGKSKINWVNTYKALREMVEDGVVDIYLPNDIHWGYQGYKAAYLATKEKIEELKNSRL